MALANHLAVKKEAAVVMSKRVENTSNDSSSVVLIVEDDRKTSALIATYLQRDGFQTLTVANGCKAVEAARSQQLRFVILDLMLPGMNGWDVCREIRKLSNVPILFLTARDDESDRVLGLSLGADDYVIKPFSPRELVARVQAILRRVDPARHTSPIFSRNDPMLKHQGLSLDLEKRRLKLFDEAVELTPSEYSLLKMLMHNPGHVFLRSELLAKLYPDGEAVIDRVVDVHIGKLRQKIEFNPKDPQFVITVRGVGYRFADRE